MIFVRREGLPVEDLAVSRISSQKKTILISPVKQQSNYDKFEFDLGGLEW